MLHFEMGLRAGNDKPLIKSKSTKRNRKVFSPKEIFWIGKQPCHINKKENLVIKIG